MATSSQLASSLAEEVRSRNINACAGILRRLVSSHHNASAVLREHSSVVSSAVSLGTHVVASPNPSDPPITSTSLSILANISAAMERWKDALTFVDPKRPGASCYPSPVFLAKLMNKQNVGPVADWCDDREVRFCVPTAIARIGVLGGAWDAALRLAVRYESHGERYSTGVIVPLLANGGHWEMAIKVFRDAISQGNMVDLALIENILSTTATCGHWQAALAILSDLDKCIVTNDLASSPTILETYQQILNVSPSWEGSLKVLDIVKRTTQRPPPEKMIAAALSTADKCGHWETATTLFDYARENGIVQNLPESSKEMLVRNFRATAQWERALETLQWMSKATDASVKEGLIATIDVCEQSGQWEAALKAADEALTTAHGSVPVETYMSILSACVKGKQPDKAITYFSNMLSDVAIIPPPMSVCLVLKACIEASKFEEALAVYRKVESMGQAFVTPPAAHRLAMIAAMQSGKWEECLLLVNTMQRSGLPHDALTQRYGLWAAALTGSWRTSLAIYNKMPLKDITRKDRELVRLSAHKAGPVAQSIVKQLSGQTVGKRKP